MQYLLINILSLDSQAADYAVLENESATTRLTHGDWETIGKKARSKKVIVTIPSEQILLSNVIIPSKNKKQRRQAVPFALEDNLAEDLDLLNFAMHTASNDKKTWVAIMNRQLLQEWVAFLKEKGLQSAILLPDIFLLKQDVNSWTLSVDKQRALLRTGPFSGFSCDTSILPNLIEKQVEIEAEYMAENLIIYADGDLNLKIPEGLRVETWPSDKSIQMSSLITAIPLNLKQGLQQGSFAKQINWKRWLTSTVLLLICLLTYLVSIAIQNHQLEEKNSQLLFQAKQVFLKTFPNRKKVVDPRIQMETELNRLRKSTGKIDSVYLEMLYKTGISFTTDSTINIKVLRYRFQELTFSLESNNIKQLEVLKDKIAKDHSHYQTELRAISSGNNKVTAKLIVKENK